ncbi:MAG: HU family DNA-binding protein [Deltaproteobacteria bacterium]|nr:HU family DNA-binding protein [Deltaproteobacteria bacterium]
MTKAELIRKVARKTGASQALTGRVLDSAFQEMQSLLLKGDSIALTGFGSFSISKRNSRRGYNPQTGREMTIPARRSVRFKTGKALREALGS